MTFSTIATVLGVTALAAGSGVAGYAAAGGFSSKDESVDSRVSTAVGTGELTEEEAQSTAKKRAYRSGILYTSPTGLDSDAKTSSAKLR